MLVLYWILLVISALAALGAAKSMYDGNLSITSASDMVALTWVVVSLYISINAIFLGA